MCKHTYIICVGNSTIFPGSCSVGAGLWCSEKGKGEASGSGVPGSSVQRVECEFIRPAPREEHREGREHVCVHLRISVRTVFEAMKNEPLRMDISFPLKRTEWIGPKFSTYTHTHRDGPDGQWRKAASFGGWNAQEICYISFATMCQKLLLGF